MAMTDEIVEAVAEVYGFDVADVAAAYEALGHPEGPGLEVRFVDLARFAQMNGLDIRRLAEFVVRETSGEWPPGTER